MHRLNQMLVEEQHLDMVVVKVIEMVLVEEEEEERRRVVVESGQGAVWESRLEEEIGWVAVEETERRVVALQMVEY